MATPRNRQYHPGGGRGGNSGGGLGDLIAAFVGAPRLTGGEDITNSIDPEVDLGTSGAPVRAPYGVTKPTLGQKIFNPKGVQSGYDMENMLKFEDYQNQLRSGLVDQHNQGQVNVENLRLAGKLAEQEAASQQALKKLAWEHASSPEEYEKMLQDPEVIKATRQGLIDTGYKQGEENRKTNAQTREIEAGIPTKSFLPLPENASLYNAANGLTITSRGPLQYEPAPGYAGGVGASRLPVSGSGGSIGGGRFVPTPGGVAAEVGSFSPPDVSEMGNLFQPYSPQGSGSNPTVAGPQPAPKSQPLQSSNPFAGLGDKLSGLLNNYTKPFQGAANYIKSIPTPKVDTGRFTQDFTDPIKSILSTIIGQSPRPIPNPNAYEQYLQQQQGGGPVTPSLQPVIQPPSILEEMKKRRQMLFPTPIQPYPYGR